MDKISSVLIEVLKVSEEDTVKDLKMDDVDNWDSLTHMNLIVSLEDVLKLELSGDEIAEMISFNEIRKIISNHIEA